MACLIGFLRIWQPATLTAAEARGFPAIQLFVERLHDYGAG